MTTEFEGLELQTLRLDEPQAHVLRVTLDRPQVMNAINTRMGEELLALWQRLIRDAGNWRCVILTGAGDRAFCAGGDLKERDGMTEARWRAQHEIFERAYFALLEVPIPVLAAINGVAYGGGLETALACDFIYAARHARCALSEVRLGIMPGGGGTQNLARAVGERRAKELILRAQPFDAEQGLAWGLFNRVVAVEELMSEALRCAGDIAANGPLAVRQAKKSIHQGLQTDLLTGSRFEIEAYNRLVSSKDRLEGVRAFNEKRPPQFTGE
jgi:enoyl-CoA hydratase/carnithine racemase